MATAKKPNKSKMALRVDEALQTFEQDKFPQDDEFGAGDLSDLSGPERFSERQKSQEEVVLDELLQSAPQSAGYYLKLEKEVLPNQFEFKMRINNYATWADMEWEIAKIVQEHTRRAPQRWGSGRYRIKIWNDGGMRGNKYPDKEFLIDAGEFEQPPNVAQNISPVEYWQSQLGNMEKFMESVKGFMPPQADPEKTQELLGQAYMKGMELKSGENTNSATMMQTMMTSMMTLVTTILQSQQNQNGNSNKSPTQTLAEMLQVMTQSKDMLGLNGNNAPKLTDTIRELKDIGAWPDNNTSLTSQIATIKGIATALGDLGGGAERPGIVEKLVDAIGPALPKVLEVLTKANSKPPTYVLRTLPNGQVVQVPVDPATGQPYGPYAGTPSSNGNGNGSNPAPTLSERGFTHTRMDSNQNMMFNPSEDFVRSHPQAPSASSQPASPFQSKPEPPPAPMTEHFPQPQSMAGDPNAVTPTRGDTQVEQFLLELKQAIIQQNDDYFPIIAMSIKQADGGLQLLDDLMSQKAGPDVLKSVLQIQGGVMFQDPTFQDPLLTYTTRFVNWLRLSYSKQQYQAPSSSAPIPESKPPPPMNKPPFQGRCSLCGAIFDYEGEDEFLRELEHICGEEQGGGQTCEGMVEPLRVSPSPVR